MTELEPTRRCIQFRSVPTLLLELCKSLLESTIPGHSLQSSEFSSSINADSRKALGREWREVDTLCKKLRKLCLDVILLRRWEWTHIMKEQITCPISLCLGQTLFLYHQGRSKDAERLSCAITWLTEAKSELSEVNSLLRFLFLLSSQEETSVSVVSAQTRKDCLYVHYPSAIFEGPLDTATGARVAMATQLFEEQPGLGFNGFMAQFSVDPVLRTTLFGGLAHSFSSDLNDLLGLPALPLDHTHLSLLSKTPPNYKVQGPPSTPFSPHPKTTSNVSLLAAAADYNEVLLRGWEGWLPGTPFLYDAAPPSADHASLVVSSNYADLIGLPSPPVRLSPLLLPQLLQSAVDEVPRPSLQPVLDTDSILFSVSHSLHRLLVFCRTKLLVQSELNVSALQSECSTHSLLPVIQSVLELIKTTSQMDKFELMEGLYQQASQLQGTPHYFIFLSLLSQALLSYLKVVEKWVMFGQLDSNQSFGIHANENALVKRDEQYWNDGFLSPTGCVPPFLSHLSLPILTCGKALNLLCLCQPKHPLCTGEFSYPPLKLLFSSHQLFDVEANCQLYSSRITNYCKFMSQRLADERLAQQQEEQAVLIQARQEARKEGDRIRQLERAKLEADVLHKQSLAKELKEEMEKMQAQRSQSKDQERRADQEFIATLSQKEQILESEAHLEVEQHYEQLSQEAERRKAVAQWRLARLQLSSAREALWREQAAQWRQEAASSKSQDSKPENAETHGGDNLGKYHDQTKTTDPGPPPISPDQKLEDEVNQLSSGAFNQKNSDLTTYSRGQVPPSTIQDLIQDNYSDDVDHASSRGQAPPSTIQHLIQNYDSDDVNHTSSRGQAPPSTIQHLIQNDTGDVNHTSRPPSTIQHLVQNDDTGDVNHPSSRGQAPLSTIQHLIQNDDSDDVNHTSSRGQAPPSTIQHLIQNDTGDVNHTSSRGQAPPSTIQHLIRNDDTGDVNHTSSRGQAPPSTIQHLIQNDTGDVNHTSRPPSTIQHLVQNDDTGDVNHASSRGQAPLSTIQHLIRNDDTGDVNHTSSRGQAPPSTIQHLIQNDTGDMNHTSSRGQAPPSTIQHLFQNTSGSSNTGHTSSRGHAPPSTVQYLIRGESESGLAATGPIQHVGDPQLVSSRGQAPPSSIQSLLYYGVKKPLVTEPNSAPYNEGVTLPSFSKFSDDFSTLDAVPSQNMLEQVLGTTHTSTEEVHIDFLSLFPLTSLITNSVQLPLLTQCQLVNQALLDHLISHCQLDHHFLALKRFLLLEDGEFGHALSTKLCQQLHFGSDWQVLCSPSFLNPLLASALEFSLHHHSLSAPIQLGFSLLYQPHNIHCNAVKALDFLELKYKVDWPCNVVITSHCLHRYNKILHFLLEMKHSSWVLKQTFHQLKNCQVLSELQVRELQTYRHEFQHFVNLMHGYIASQLFGFTWKEFQTELTQQVTSLDDLIQAHHKFIERALFRCLLSKKARPVMNLIYELFSSILTFSSQVAGLSSHNIPGCTIYTAICTTHNNFQDTARLLISVLGKLIARGYQPHLEELLLRLNFNCFY